MKNITSLTILKLLWIQSWVAMIGSLYLSEIMQFPPCALCWYQRVCMYPLAAIFLVGVWLKDVKAFLYGLPLVVIGWIIAFYHTLLYYNILPESAAPCREGISCTTQQLMLFGFVSIPLLSLVAFSIILAGTVLALRKNNTV